MEDLKALKKPRKKSTKKSTKKKGARKKNKKSAKRKLTYWLKDAANFGRFLDDFRRLRLIPEADLFCTGADVLLRHWSASEKSFVEQVKNTRFARNGN